MKKKNKDKPLFLKANDPSTWKKPDEVTWGDYSFNPALPLTSRQREVCRLHVTGLKQDEIALKLGYTQPHVSRILQSSKAKREIERIHDKVFEKTVAERVKDLGNPAIDVFEDILHSNDPEVKPQLKLDAAKWVAEKISGKAKQEVEFQGSIAVSMLDRMQEMQRNGQIIDVTKSATTQTLDGTKELTDEEKARQKLDNFFDTDL